MSRLSTLYQQIFSLSTTRALQLYQILRQGAVIGTSIALAKSGLSTADIGVYETLLYIGAVLSFFWVNGLLQAMTPVYSQLPASDKQHFFFNVFLVFAALSFGLGALLLLGGSWVVPLLTGLKTVPYYQLFCWYLLLQLPSYPVEYIYLLRKKARSIVAWGIVSFGLQVLAVVLPLLLGNGLQESMQALVALGVVRLLWTLVLFLRLGGLVWRFDLVQRYLRFGWPLMLNVTVGNLVLMFDNWLAGWWYRDEAVFAVFRYGSRELPLAQALATALGVAIIPRLVEDWEAGMADLKAMSRRLFHLLFPLTILFLFISKPLFPLVFNPDFAASAPLFNIYLLITASRVLLPNSMVLAKGEPRIILFIGLAELAVKIALGFVFIYFWGLVGLAWSAVLAFALEKVLMGLYLYRKHDILPERWLDWKVYGVYVVLMVVAYWVV